MALLKVNVCIKIEATSMGTYTLQFNNPIYYKILIWPFQSGFILSQTFFANVSYNLASFSYLTGLFLSREQYVQNILPKMQTKYDLKVQ